MFLIQNLLTLQVSLHYPPKQYKEEIREIYLTFALFDPRQHGRSLMIPVFYEAWTQTKKTPKGRSMTSQSIHSKHPRTSLMRSRTKKSWVIKAKSFVIYCCNCGFMLTVSNIPMIFKHNLKGNTGFSWVFCDTCEKYLQQIEFINSPIFSG